MNDDLMDRLLFEGESSSLDYKRDQYPFTGATDDEKSELLKDILVFANGWRHADAYILIGVEEVLGGRSTVVGVSHHLTDNDLQQIVNSKTNRPVIFSYQAYLFEAKQVGIIAIPQQDRPIYLVKDYGKLKKHLVKNLLEAQRDADKKEQVRATLGLGTKEGFYADIYNSGDVPKR